MNLKLHFAVAPTAPFRLVQEFRGIPWVFAAEQTLEGMVECQCSVTLRSVVLRSTVTPSTDPPPPVTLRRAEQARAHEIHQLGAAEASAILAKGEAEAKVRTPTCASGVLS